MAISMSVRSLLFAAAPGLLAALHTKQAPNSTFEADMDLSMAPYSMAEDDEADVRCYDTNANICPPGQTPHAQLQAATAKAHSHLQQMRSTCLGATWDGAKCLELLQSYRQEAILHIQGLVANDASHFFQRSSRMCHAPVVHHFRAGGGLRGDMPCREDGKVSFFYRHIFKAAGLAIKKNMAHNAGLKYGEAVDRDWWTNNRCEEYTSLKASGDHPVLFTFVREPIEKFIAGYKELCTRGIVPDLRGTRMGTTEHAKVFLDMVFHGTCDNDHLLLQAQSLVNDACESKFDFIGKLENFDEDWANVSDKGHCTKPLRWMVDPQHASQVGDGDEFDAAMRQVLKQNNNALMKALCWWTLPDYEIFDYQLPAQCASDPAFQHV